MNKALLCCPRCENEGRRYILGEFAPTGHILIQRVHGNNGQYRNFTIVGGNDFYLVCDRCGTNVFFRKVQSSIVYGTVVNSLHAQTNQILGSSETEFEKITIKNGSQESTMEGGTSWLRGITQMGSQALA